MDEKYKEWCSRDGISTWILGTLLTVIPVFCRMNSGIKLWDMIGMLSAFVQTKMNILSVKGQSWAMAASTMGTDFKASYAEVKGLLEQSSLSHVGSLRGDLSLSYWHASQACCRTIGALEWIQQWRSGWYCWATNLEIYLDAVHLWLLSGQWQT